MPLCRASELDRLLLCPGSAPGVLERDDFKPTHVAKAAQWGVVCHEWKETGILPDSLPYAKLLDEKIKTAPVHRMVLWPKEGEHEVALAYNVITGRALRAPEGSTSEYKDIWKREFGDEWITGTLDFAMELMDEPWVDDLKTGRLVEYKNYKYQQAFYCLAWSKVRYKELRDVRSTLTLWPKYPKTAKPYRVGKVITGAKLAVMAKKLLGLREVILEARGTKGPLVAGEQCFFCPSKAFCTEYKKLELAKDKDHE